MSACKYKPGDIVSLECWDKYERPVNRLGLCEVVSITPARCESGWMMKVRSLEKGTIYDSLDQNWLTPIPETMEVE